MTSPYLSSADETLAQLDRLFREENDRKSLWRQRLDALVANLGASSGPAYQDPSSDPMGQPPEPAPRRVARQEEQPFVALPERTTHGGPFGPAVRQKLISEALAKRGW